MSNPNNSYVTEIIFQALMKKQNIVPRYSVPDLLMKLNVSLDTLNQWLEGHLSPDSRQILILCNELNLDYDQIKNLFNQNGSLN